jgi:hypothetical protein
MAKEKKEEAPADSGAQLFTLLEEKGKQVQDSGLNWPKWYADQTVAALPYIKPGKPEDIPGNTYMASLHYGLLMMHGSGHPLFGKLTREEQEAREVYFQACNRIFRKQEEQGIYGTFQARLNASR